MQEISEFGQTSLKGIMVHGTAIKEVTSRNGVKYVAKELEKATASIRNKPILKDHKNEVDSIVGKVVDSNFDTKEKAIKFKGIIVDEKIKDLIRAGMINHVSIGANAKLKQEEHDGEQKCMLAEDLEILELSVTPVPGVPQASIMPGEHFIIALEEAYKMVQEKQHDCPECDMKFDSKEELDKHMGSKHKNENVEVKNKMEEINKDLLLAKEALIEAILGFDNTWKKESLSVFPIEALKELLSKVRESSKKVVIPEKAEPKGLVKNNVEESTEEKSQDNVLIMPVEANSMLRGIKANTYVFEKTAGNKVNIWKMPDYKKQKWY